MKIGDEHASSSRGKQLRGLRRNQLSSLRIKDTLHPRLALQDHAMDATMGIRSSTRLSALVTSPRRLYVSLLCTHRQTAYRALIARRSLQKLAKASQRNNRACSVLEVDKEEGSEVGRKEPQRCRGSFCITPSFEVSLDSLLPSHSLTPFATPR